MPARFRFAMIRGLALVLGLSSAAWPATAPADLVVLNGKVLTVDAAFRIAEAVAIRDGVFVLVGHERAGPGAGRPEDARHRRRAARR